MKYLPISFWEHNKSTLSFEFRVEHALCNTEDEAYKTANKDWTFGLFVAPSELFVTPSDLSEKKLHFGFIDKKGEVYHVPKRHVKGYFLNPTVAERLASPIDVSNHEGKTTATEALLALDPAYMISSTDYVEDPMMTTNEGMSRIPGAAEVTSSRPLLFGSTSYSITPSKS